jgi:hypothetical protein
LILITIGDVMRTLVRLPATSTLLIALALTPAFAGTTPAAAAEVATRPQPATEIRLVRLSSQAKPGGGELVRYGVFQRVQPLLAVNVEGAPVPDAVIGAADPVTVSYELEAQGWASFAMITVEEFGPPPARVYTPAATDATSEVAPAEPLVLAIAPVRPLPARSGALLVDVTLPGDGPARLEMLDVMGRRVASRELGSLGAGRHAVDLAADRRFAPGVYLLRLTQAGDSKVARVTVID